jgi:hypothetical protein
MKINYLIVLTVWLTFAGSAQADDAAEYGVGAQLSALGAVFFSDLKIKAPVLDHFRFGFGMLPNVIKQIEITSGCITNSCFTANVVAGRWNGWFNYEGYYYGLGMEAPATLSFDFRFQYIFFQQTDEFGNSATAYYPRIGIIWRNSFL